jgi:predicted AAA+ superfamily ATPase
LFFAFTGQGVVNKKYVRLDICSAYRVKLLTILSKLYKRLIYNEIKKRIDDPRRFIQVLSGPRQTGKTTLSRDILLMTRVHKPALLRRLFELGCSYSGQILSYQKMIGQLQDVGNTTTLAHYLNLLQGAGLLVGLAKYAGEKVRQRASSPKLLVLNTGLMTAKDIIFKLS